MADNPTRHDDGRRSRTDDDVHGVNPVNAIDIAQVQSDLDISAVGILIREYTTWAFTLDEDSDRAPTFTTLEEELATLPGIFAPPSGRLLLAKYNGEPAGTIAFLGHDAERCELKRLYVRPSFRKFGIGRQLVSALLAQARSAGYRQVELSSHFSMTQAHNLYQALGFRIVDAPKDFPAFHRDHVVFMEYALLADTTDGNSRR